jgi:uncharacterized protein (TIGR02588 family)
MASEHAARSAGRKSQRNAPPLLEWISGGIGLAIALGTLGFLASRAMSHSGAPPALSAHIDRIVQVADGYTVTVTVRNASRATAATVQVEGTLTDGAREARRSLVTIDYVPGNSARRAGLLFDLPPTEENLTVRVIGYTDP